MARSARPIRLRTGAVRPTGPRLYRVTKKMVRLGGPGAPPPNFVGGANSASEWHWYWASMRVLDPQTDPRQPPFYGGQQWSYQSPQLGQFTRALGSAVADFVYHLGETLLIMRIQTGYFHLTAPAAKQAIDTVQLRNLMGMAAGHMTVEVVDIYDVNFLSDTSGQSAIVLLKESLGLIRRVDPIVAGVARVVRNPAAI